MSVTKITGTGLGLPTADGNALGGTSNEWSDFYLADGGVIYFGSDQEVKISHQHNSGLNLKHTATPDNQPFILVLQTGETNMEADDVLGQIAFQAPDETTGSDAILVGAAIQARSEGDFSASSNATTLDFMTAASEAATTTMTLSSAGALDVTGDITGSTINADGDTAASDNAAMGYTSAEGLILTGQGSTNDVTIKNDADADVITIATGGTAVDVVGALTAGSVASDAGVSGTTGTFSAGVSGTTGTFTSTVDINGSELILDADADTSITADTDDQIDIKIAGADDFRFTANNFNVLSGSTLTIDSGATITNSGTATGFADLTAIADGSASAPSIANSGDTNTGIYFPAADTVGVVAGGTEKFRFGSNPIPGGTKNLLINGGMNIDQYGGVGNVGDANYVYFIDGWCSYYGYGSTARYSVIQSNGPEGAYSASSMQLSINVADTDTSTANRVSAFIQKIEGQNVRGLDWGTSGARATSLSFWIRSPVNGTHCVALYAQDGNRTCPIEYTITSADVWQYVSVTFPGDTGGTAIPNDNTPAIWVVFPLHTGSTYEGTSGSWQAGEKYGTSSMVNMVGATSKYVLLTDVQLEIGSVSTDFALEPYSTELAKCQRYYYSFDITAGPRWGVGGYDAGNALGTYVNHPVQMRASPTSAFTNSAFRLAHNGSVHTNTVSLSFSTDKFGYHAQSTHSGSPTTQGEWYWILNNGAGASPGGSGDITFDAEL